MGARIAFVGGGHMATALIGGLLHEGWSPGDIDVLDPNPEQGERLAARFGVRTFVEACGALRDATAVVWAVKPQMVRAAVQPVAPLTRHALHISIAAGISVADLTDWIGSPRIVRSMPNLPAVVRAGVTGLCASPDLTPADRELAARILGSAGHVFWVACEDEMDAVTAISGSGPGYVYHFLEGFQQAAQALGFAPARARELVLRVAQGAVQLALADATDLRALREQVSSKGGTTVAGTSRLDVARTQVALLEAVGAAHARARELGAQRPIDG